MLISKIQAKVLAGAVAVITLVTVGHSGGEAAPTAEELLSYEEQVVTIAQGVGRLIEFGGGDAYAMKPAVGAIDRGTLGGAELADNSATWVEFLCTSREQLDEIEPPAGLGTAHVLFKRSFATYEQVALTLGRIADADGPGDFGSLLERAVTLGSLGDEQFDRAGAVVQRHRRALGLTPSTKLPDPEHPLPPGIEIID